MRASFSACICSLAALLLGACATLVPVPTQEDAAWAQGAYPGVTLKELTEDRRLYVGKCAGCHTLYPVDHVDADQWDAAVDAMVEKGRIEAADQERIVRYLVTAHHALSLRPR